MADHLKKIGLIGVGAISDWHVQALHVAGLKVTAVSSRKGSTRLSSFAAKHQIPNIYPDWETLLKDRESWDALVLATHVDGTADCLSAALEMGVPVLVEKPVALSSKIIQKLCHHAHSLVQVGYHRRFYRTILSARQEASKKGPLMAQLQLPENIQYAGNETHITGHYLYRFFQNSCHGIDMLRFVFGDLKIEKVRHFWRADGKLGGFSALFSTQRGDVLTLNANWLATANCSFILDWPERRMELKPLEEASIYEGMEVIEPNEKSPMRQYVPKLKERILLENDGTQKPGFAEQANAFKTMIKTGKKSPLAATLADAYWAIKFCEDLVGDAWDFS